MKNILSNASALAVVLAACSVAQAADVTSPAPYDWSGLYAGVNAGIAWSNTDIEQSHYIRGNRIKDLDENVNSNQSAFTGGAMIGYNYQIDSIVLGAEADFNYLGFSDDQQHDRDHVAPNGHAVDAMSRQSFDANWYGTVRGRLGYAIDNLMLYGTGGLAYGHMKAKAELDVVGPLGKFTYEGSTSTTNFGWTAGGGFEYGLDRWTLGAEYLFVDLGSAEWDGDVTPAVATADAKGSVDYQFSVVRATAKLRF